MRLWMAALCAALLAACRAPPAAQLPPSGSADGGNRGAGTFLVSVAISGAGRVVSAPAGIDCPGTCSAAFPAGTGVNLAAAAAAPASFAGWQGACTGMGPCAVAASATVSAAFVAGRPSALSVVPVEAEAAHLRLSSNPMRVFIRQWVRFDARAGGVSEPRVTWSVREGNAGGAIGADGTYTAPAQPGVYHVVATALGDATLSGECEVQVVASQAAYDYGGPILPEPRLQLVWRGERHDFGGAVELLHAFLAGVNGSSWLAALDQYMRGAKAAIETADDIFLESKGPVAADAGAEICRALETRGLAPSANTIYALILSGSSGTFDYHALVSCGGVGIPILVVALPDAGAAAEGACNGAMTAAEKMLWAFSHELSETMTDPEPVTAWADLFDQEIADDCVRPTCANLPTGSFTLTALLSNAVGGCVP